MRRRVAAAVCAAALHCAAGLSGARGGGIIDLGSADEFTLSQPIVQVQVGTFASYFNEYLLDTGASGILAGKSASDDLRSLGLQTDATYIDYGVAGPEATQVSKPYSFAFAGTDGVARTLPAVRMQTSNGNFGFYSGIAGMPLMAGRTTRIDLAAQAEDVFVTFGRMGVAFDTPFPAPTAHQYSVPLTMQLFPATGQQNPADPLPANAPLPFAPVQVQYGATRRSGEFLLDTGAQQCILSRTMAFDLGLDINGNGDLDDEAISFQEVAGVGGSVQIPVLRIDSLALRAAAGVDLLFRDIVVGIVDIDPAIPGVLGMNVLNSGWEAYSFNLFTSTVPLGPPGVIDRIDLDFRDAAAQRGEMRLSVSAPRDTFISQGPVVLAVAGGVQTQAQAGHAAIGGVGTVTKTGAGTAVLNAVNTVTGTTFVQGGTLRIDEPNALFGSPTVVQPGAMLAVTDGVTARLPAVTLAGGTLSARAIVVNGSSGISTLTIASGVLAGGPALSVGVGGRVSLTGPSMTIAVSKLAVDQAAGGKIDLGRGRIGIAAGGIREADLLADIAAGRGNGAWTGTAGITSSSAASDVSGGRLRAVGWLTGSDGGITVGFAAAGDTNLDGVIDILDAVNLVGGALFDTGRRAVWAQGDFNYDGLLDILDVADFVGTGLFDSGDYLSAASGGTGLAGGEAVGFAAVAVVPEPATPMLVAVAAVAFFLGRRRPG